MTHQPSQSDSRTQFGMDPLLLRMFEKLDLSRKPGSGMAAHMPLLQTLARFQSFGPVVECGVGEGFSTFALFLGVLEGGGHLTSYDIRPECQGQVLSLMELEPRDNRLKSWRFTVRDSARAARDWKDGSVSLFFLDTTHFLETTRTELEAWSPKMHPQGIMCGHDYLLHLSPRPEDQKTAVKTAVDQFVAKHRERFRLQVFPDDFGLFVLWPREVELGGLQVP
jgi:predicted O-methyltransferase YrrM